MKVMHIITGLSTGGAEMMLFKLLAQTDLKKYESEVVSLTNFGPVGERISQLGVRVRALNMRRGVLNPVAAARLYSWLRKSAPDVVQTWMYHADLMGGLMAKIAGVRSIAWGIHHSTLDPKLSKRSTILTAKMCAKGSKTIPNRIVCCSESSRTVHSDLGYDSSKMVVIPNGFDLSDFKPDPAMRDSLRQELAIPLDAAIVGLVGRFNPQKDHQGFIQAASLLSRKLPNVHFVLCGDDIVWENEALSAWIQAVGIASKCHLLGRRHDIARLFAAFDVFCSASYSEAFPNVIGEAMACGVPCVVTDVGDCAAMVGNTGKVVAPSDSAALAKALADVLQLTADERAALGVQARNRVDGNYSLSMVVSRYERLYDELANGGSGCR